VLLDLQKAVFLGAQRHDVDGDARGMAPPWTSPATPVNAVVVELGKADFAGDRGEVVERQEQPTQSSTGPCARAAGPACAKRNSTPPRAPSSRTGASMPGTGGPFTKGSRRASASPRQASRVNAA
jgi:hypothetical protein